MAEVQAGAATTKAAQPDAMTVAREWLAAGQRVALATVVATWGSSPVPIGGQMAVAENDLFQGSVSGGCVESDIIVAAADVIANGSPQLLTFGVSNETAWRSGLPCGGTISILVVALAQTQTLPLLESIATMRAAREPAILVTNVADGGLSLYDARVRAALPGFVAEVARDGISRMAENGAGEQAFVHLLLPPPRVVIIGATHIAQHLVAMLGLIGYDAIIVDPRTAYANEQRFAGVEIIAEWPDDALPGIGLDPFTAVVVVAHTPEIDDQALRHALAAGCRYVGALGSTRNHARRRERLAASGVAVTDIDRVRAPIGLPIGAHGAAEIAVSILAEIIAVFREPTAPR